MQSGSSRYRKLNEDESSHHMGDVSSHNGPSQEGFAVELGTLNRQGYAALTQAEMDVSVHPNPPTLSPNEFIVRVLCRERTHEVHGLSPSSTVHDLKQKLISLVDLPPERQRLILAGKLLRPEDKTLDFFKVTTNSVVHLFPMPANVPTATPVSATTSSTAPPSSSSSLSVTVNPMHVNGSPFGSFLPAGGALFDPQINQWSKEVRLWCMVLMFLSCFTLFNNLSYFGTTGKFGRGFLDSIVFALDTCCSAGGVWVASMGMRSLRNLDMAEMKRYVHYLGILAVACIVMRIIWIFDIMVAVQTAVRDQKKNQNDAPTDGTSSTQNPPLGKDAVESFTIQASVVALIIIYAWVSCYMRARRLHQAIESLQQGQNGANVRVEAVL